MQSRKSRGNKSPQNNTNNQVKGNEYQTIFLNDDYKFMLPVRSDNSDLLRGKRKEDKELIEFISLTKVQKKYFSGKEQMRIAKLSEKKECQENNQSYEVYEIRAESRLVGYQLLEKNTKRKEYYVFEKHINKR